MPPIYDPVALLKELQESNLFFDELVDMIPAKLYIAGNSGKTCRDMCQPVWTASAHDLVLCRR